MSPASALELRYRMRVLARKYQISPQPHIIPLIDPVPGAVIIRGVAATADTDLEKMRLAPGALDPLPRHVPLWLHHDPVRRLGEIDELEYQRDGTLRISARVEDPEARRLGGLSVGLRIIRCELVDADGPDFYAILHKAELVEVSLTDRPSNPAALVQSRIPACISDVYAHGISAMNCFSSIITLMQQEIRRHA